MLKDNELDFLKKLVEENSFSRVINNLAGVAESLADDYSDMKLKQKAASFVALSVVLEEMAEEIKSIEV